MKLRLTREIHYSDGRVVSNGAIGEPTLMIWDSEERDSKVVEIEMLFYGYPGLYMVRAGDLENL